eukprot:10182580-Alexandrium_andersonii.AAC.1
MASLPAQLQPRGALDRAAGRTRRPPWIVPATSGQAAWRSICTALRGRRTTKGSPWAARASAPSESGPTTSLRRTPG